MSDIHPEMMAHVPLFSHRQPKTVAILADTEQRIMREVLQHSSIIQVWEILEEAGNPPTDARVHSCYGKTQERLAELATESLDVLIIADATATDDYSLCFKKLRADGLFMQSYHSSFAVEDVKIMQKKLRAAGFSDVLMLRFLPWDLNDGAHSAVIAVKQGALKRPREKDIFNKPFATKYYNLEMHKAAFALPEFIRQGEAEWTN